ncbi:bifunctional diaminohydroxyphosphoribosylaminopyrimidine deaminase/5-amino-6-(5-phosphoribosylamino)uracil reductase RibD [Limnoglobus roseus]|uniref:Riboflavin biosynthesis protein RibD n=1 Tax=Limnoglobus roseus TaxID=2598579 RepID=A0A5C1A7V6_9BACT|nr:bifunctional diaminohydroxyphosphoribosylaminopyrimidine deaminase/5-amino-6-(5-phosphoribosylamino)uracil reductase RibD [Limnoglobus roseus]QEL14317.1 bifunctional diaminohydroxyphosphoribosylaminopyrimidine deaminase/5-amino-6-(5-phosphoribosylamino)uracil reductase RibD [Limnoglobus roseus]
MSDDERWMTNALALAARGRGAVEPNPMVGAVVLDAAGQLAGEGWHRKFGEAHAEVNAFAAVGDKARGGTLLVTLEPCCHHGKTPPCTEAVLRSGVRRVVVAMADPFPKVAGGGLKILRDAGIEVTVGVREAEAKKLNAPYLKLLATGRPWVHLKWAMTLDGKIATRTGDSKWISGEESRAIVHELRGRVDAILVGTGTVTADDPALTARPSGPRTATRVVVTASGELPERCQLRSTARDVPVIVFTPAGNESKLARWADDGAEVIAVSTPSPPALRGRGQGEGEERPAAADRFIGEEGIPPHPNPLPLKAGEEGIKIARLSIGDILLELGRRRMTNVLVEGGAGLIGSFLDANAADEVHAFIAPVVVGGDTALSPAGGHGFARIADAARLIDAHVRTVGQDVYVNGRLH